MARQPVAEETRLRQDTPPSPVPAEPQAEPQPPQPPETETGEDFSNPAPEPQNFARDHVFSNGFDEERDSPFAPEPPFRPRRNPARLWTIAAVVFSLLVVAAGGALYYFGPPSWAVRAGLIADAGEPDLLFYLSKPAERRKLSTGQEFFAFSARIVNSGSERVSVPSVVVELRDEQNRLVFSWTTKADKSRLNPGEEASINESRLDIPKNAVKLSLSFLNHGS